ncbi:MAG: hypothetical protein HYR60_31060 [Acidobacteria bacterium]|nr:hypothetical protein [Acidobacteriota bacterium]
MSKDRKARAVTVAVLTGALALVLAQRNGWRLADWKPSGIAAAPKSAPTPQDAIYAMLDAARAGDVQVYLAAYAGPMEVSLKQSLAETGAEGFARYLKESNAAIKGIAITEPQPLTDREVKVRVEYVYQDRNEAQFMYLEKGPSGWKIARVDGTERVKTLVPYGTPVQ